MEQLLAELIEALGNEDGPKRKRARETLTLVGEPAVPLLRGLLSAADKRLRWEAAKCLAEMVDPASADAFVELVTDEYSEVRWLAGSGLINLGPRSAAPVLGSLIRHPESRGNQESARRILRKLASDNGVLAEIVGPVVDTLDHPDPAVIASRAAVALNELEKITGVRHPMGSASSPAPQV